MREHINDLLAEVRKDFPKLTDHTVEHTDYLLMNYQQPDDTVGAEMKAEERQEHLAKAWWPRSKDQEQHPEGARKHRISYTSSSRFTFRDARLDNL